MCLELFHLAIFTSKWCSQTSFFYGIRLKMFWIHGTAMLCSILRVDSKCCCSKSNSTWCARHLKQKGRRDVQYRKLPPFPPSRSKGPATFDFHRSNLRDISLYMPCCWFYNDLDPFQNKFSRCIFVRHKCNFK